MRSLWCTVVALCLVAGGVRVREPVRSHADHCELHATVHGHVTAARRHAVHGLGPVVAVDAHEPVPPHAVLEASIARADLAPTFASCFVRSSRGPPYA